MVVVVVVSFWNVNLLGSCTVCCVSGCAAATGAGLEGECRGYGGTLAASAACVPGGTMSDGLEAMSVCCVSDCAAAAGAGLEGECRGDGGTLAASAACVPDGTLSDGLEAMSVLSVVNTSLWGQSMSMSMS